MRVIITCVHFIFSWMCCWLWF